MKYQYLTKAELYQLLQAAKSKDKETWIMLLVGYWHGLRASEIVNIRSKQIKGGYLTVQRLKGSEKTIQKLVSCTDSILSEREYLEELARTKDMLFKGVSRFALTKRMMRLGASIGLPPHKCHAHVLKHTCGIHGRNNGVEIEALQTYLGHKSLASTGVYIKMGDEEAGDLYLKAAGV